MTKEKMRIKDVGATINLGNYSSLHVTIGEPSEFAGLELQRATNYLKGIAEKVGGVLALPEMKQKSSKKKEEVAPLGEKLFSFGSDTPIFYDNDTHTYTTENGVVYESVKESWGLLSSDCRANRPNLGDPCFNHTVRVLGGCWSAGNYTERNLQTLWEEPGQL